MMKTTQESLNSYHIELEAKYGAHNYKPLPVVLKKGLEFSLGCRWKKIL